MRGLIVLVIASLFLVPAVSAQQYTVSGRVLDQHGDPVAGADVYLYQYGYSEPRPVEEGNSTSTSSPKDEGYYQAQVRTDNQGYYVIQARSGWADLSIQKEGYAGAYQGFEVSGSMNQDFTVAKYPEKNASISGVINVRDASISIEYPEFGLYVCSMYEDQAAAEGSSGSSQAEPASDAMIARPYYGCDITVKADGSFSGQVYPGYAILRVYHDMWRSCPDGTCQSYYGHVQVLQLKEGANRVDVNLKARPAPDAELKGYVLDAAGAPVQGVYLSFSHQDSYSYGEGKTDQDGSFRVAVRSGLVEVSVWADGYLPWSGMVEASPDGELLVIRLTEGDSRYGGYCCYAYAEDKAAPTAAGAPAMDGAESANLGSERSGANDDATAIRDLGGGLGPYSPGAENAGKESPGVTVLALLAAIGVAFLVRRR